MKRNMRVSQPKLTRFGNPLLRQACDPIQVENIKSQACIQVWQQLISCIESKEYGVGLAAPQIGAAARIAIIDIKPTKLRPDVERYRAIIINPTYDGIGKRSSMWEGCLSSGSGKDTLYGKALRYKKINASWIDEHGDLHTEILKGLPAHVFQHETDHLNGILFVDRVRDTSTYMLADEFKKRIVSNKKSAKSQ